MDEIRKEDINGIRKTFKKLGVIAAEVDAKLRYVWIENPHPDFNKAEVVGKRDDELIPESEAKDIIAFKKSVFAKNKALTKTIRFNRSNGICDYNMAGYPVRNSDGQVESIITIGFYTNSTT
jgi:hypothetical protein